MRDMNIKILFIRIGKQCVTFNFVTVTFFQNITLYFFH